MKLFFEKYSYSSLKMFVTQFAISIFGFSLAIASGDLSKPLQYAVSGFSVLFYLVLIYLIPWKHGNEDSISVEYGKLKKDMLRGLYMGVLANSINILLALVSIFLFVVGVKDFSALLSSFNLMLQGMYTGLLTIKVGGAPLNSYAWTYLLITIPGIVTSTIAYIAGFYNFRVFKFKEKR